MTAAAGLAVGDVRLHLIRLASPATVGLASLLLLNAVDLWWVSRLGRAELAALSFVTPWMTLVAAAAQALSSGTTLVVARCLGAGDMVGARRTTGAALIAAAALGISCAVAGTVATAVHGNVSGSLGILGAEYAHPWFAACPLLCLAMVMGGTLAAHGDFGSSALVMFVGAVLNAILAPVFIFGLGPVPPLGLLGAGLATVIAIAVSTILAVVRFGRLSSVPRSYTRDAVREVRGLLRESGPLAIAHGLPAVAQMALFAIAASHGEAALAGLGIGLRSEALTIVPLLGLGAALGPLVSQNDGAKATGRVRASIRWAAIMAAVLAVASGVTVVALRSYVAGAFSDDTGVREVTMQFLAVIPMSHVGLAFVFIAVSSLNALGKGMQGSAVLALHLLGFVVPMGWAGGSLGEVHGMFIGIAGANMVGGALAFLLLRRLGAKADR